MAAPPSNSLLPPPDELSVVAVVEFEVPAVFIGLVGVGVGVLDDFVMTSFVLVLGVVVELIAELL